MNCASELPVSLSLLPALCRARGRSGHFTALTPEKPGHYRGPMLSSDGAAITRGGDFCAYRKCTGFYLPSIPPRQGMQENGGLGDPPAPPLRSMANLIQQGAFTLKASREKLCLPPFRGQSPLALRPPGTWPLVQPLHPSVASPGKLQIPRGRQKASVIKQNPLVAP